MENDNKIHWAFWVITLLGLLWNAAGIFNYMMQMKPDLVANMPDAHRMIIEGRPAWATAGFAVGVFAGAAGCLLLLLRKPLAGMAFMLSLMGIFVTMIHTLNVALSGGALSVSVIFHMILLPILVANFFIGFTFYAIKRNWMSSK